MPPPEGEGAGFYETNDSQAPYCAASGHRMELWSAGTFSLSPLEDISEKRLRLNTQIGE